MMEEIDSTVFVHLCSVCLFARHLASRIESSVRPDHGQSEAGSKPRLSIVAPPATGAAVSEVGTNEPQELVNCVLPDELGTTNVPVSGTAAR